MGLVLQSSFKKFKSRLWDSAVHCVSLYHYRSRDYVTLMTVFEIVPNFATRWTLVLSESTAITKIRIIIHSDVRHAGY